MTHIYIYIKFIYVYLKFIDELTASVPFSKLQNNSYTLINEDIALVQGGGGGGGGGRGSETRLTASVLK